MRSNFPGNHSGPRSTPGSGKARSGQQQVACDRCRGQKLRCIRTTARGTCNRCEKAGATCITDPTIRMGRRPRQVEKNSKETTVPAQQQQQQQHHKRGTSSPSSYKASSYPASECSNANGEAWPESEPADEMVDPTLTTMQYSESLGFGIPGGPFDDMSLPIGQHSDYLDGTIGMMPGHMATPFPDFGINGGLAHCETPNSIHSSGKLPKEPLAGNDPLAEIFDGRDIANMMTQPIPPSPQEPIAKVSNLNLELHQQLAIVDELIKEYRNTEPSLLKQDKKETAVVSSIAFMIQGLQTFHDLALHVLGPRDANAPTDTARHGLGEDESRARIWRHETNCPDSMNHADPRDIDIEKTLFEPWKMQLDTPSRDVGSGLDLHDGTSSMAFLDVSSSLLVISCYINLIRFCRAVFVCIRGTLALDSQQTSLRNVSGLEFSGVAIPQNPHLQLVVLIQVVIRLIDNIGLILGHPHDSTATRERKGYSKAISPHLLDFLLKQEGMAEHPSCEGGTKALREEMRKLNEVVYKSV